MATINLVCGSLLSDITQAQSEIADCGYPVAANDADKRRNSTN